MFFAIIILSEKKMKDAREKNKKRKKKNRIKGFGIDFEFDILQHFLLICTN